MNGILPLHQIYDHTIPLHGLSVAEKILRPLAVYVFLVVILRLAGKRELAQMNPLDLIVLLTLSNTVQNAIIGNDNSVTGGLIGAATLLGINFALVSYLYRHPRADRIVNGDPVRLIESGKVKRHNLARQLITEAQLRAVCRRQGVRHFHDVQTATLETSGTISIFQRHPTPEEVAFARLEERLDRIDAALAAGRVTQPPNPGG